jgi:hypothetical protein
LFFVGFCWFLLVFVDLFFVKENETKIIQNNKNIYYNRNIKKELVLNTMRLNIG